MWAPINLDTIGNYRFAMTFDGNDKTISHFVVSGTSNVGLLSMANYVKFANLNIDYATINGRNRIGTIVGQLIEGGNTFDNVNIKVIPE